MVQRDRTFQEKMLLKWEEIKELPKSKLIFAGLIFAVIIFALIPGRRGSEYQKAVSQEIEIAKIMCEEAYEWVNANRERLVLGKSSLEDFRLEGEKIEFKHLRYPEILLYATGFMNTDGDDTGHRFMYCEIRDPRSSGTKYFYNYRTREWSDSSRFRR